MLYPRNVEKELSPELFQNPTSEYRGTPFWAWNCKLTEEELLWQIDVLRQMGFGGFHMHARAGLGTEYLGPEFMDLVESCVKSIRQMRTIRDYQAELEKAYMDLADKTNRYSELKKIIPSTENGKKRAEFARNLLNFASTTLNGRDLNPEKEHDLKDLEKLEQTKLFHQR